MLKRIVCLRCVLLLFTALTASVQALAQQKTGPGVSGEDSLTWKGITLYGVVDIGVQYDTHMAPFTPYRPAASGNIVRQNSRQSVVGLTPSNMGQSAPRSSSLMEVLARVCASTRLTITAQ